MLHENRTETTKRYHSVFKVLPVIVQFEYFKRGGRGREEYDKSDLGIEGNSARTRQIGKKPLEKEDL